MLWLHTSPTYIWQLCTPLVIDMLILAFFLPLPGKRHHFDSCCHSILQNTSCE